MQEGLTLVRASHEEAREAKPAGAGEPYPLCTPREDLLYAAHAASRTALAVDRDGRFALYGVANPESGKPICDLHCKFTV